MAKMHKPLKRRHKKRKEKMENTYAFATNPWAESSELPEVIRPPEPEEKIVYESIAVDISAMERRVISQNSEDMALPHSAARKIRMLCTAEQYKELRSYLASPVTDAIDVKSYSSIFNCCFPGKALRSLDKLSYEEAKQLIELAEKCLTKLEPSPGRYHNIWDREW